MAKVLIKTMRLSAIARLMGPRRTAVVVLLALTVALAMVAMALTTSAGAMPPRLDVMRDFEDGGTLYKPPANGFNWAMEPRYGTDRDRDGITDSHWNEASGTNLAHYDQAYVNPTGFNVTFNGCPTRNEYDRSSPLSDVETQNQYTWDYGDGSPAVTVATCRPVHRYETQGPYEVKLTYSTQTTGTNSHIQTIEVRDLLIAALGDSYGAGEGAPDVPLRTRFGWGDPAIGQEAILGTWKEKDARWVDKRCHRSAYAGSAQAARTLENSDPHTSVTYISFACSGANISRDTFEPIILDGPYKWKDDLHKPKGSGLLGPYRGPEPPDPNNYDEATFLPPQVDALARTLAGCHPTDNECSADSAGRPIDALTISAGGNDAGFADILSMCTTGFPGFVQPAEFQNGAFTDCFEDPAVIKELSDRMEGDPSRPIKSLDERYDDLVKAIHASSSTGRPQLEFSQRTPDVADVYLTEYPDSMRREVGKACDSILGDITAPFPGKINNQEVQWLLTDFHAPLLQKMNAAVERANNDNVGPEWKYVGGIAAQFDEHGYCTEDRYVNTAEDARWLQGPAARHLPMSLAEINLLAFVNPFVGATLYLRNYFSEFNAGRKLTWGKVHPNVRGYRAYAESLLSDMNPLIGLPAGDPQPMFQHQPIPNPQEEIISSNGWFTGIDAFLPPVVVYKVSVDDPTGIGAAAATINDNTSCPTNTAGAAECSVVDVSAQRKEWHFRFHEDGVYRLEFTAQGNDGQTASYTRDVSVDLHDPQSFAEPSRPPDANGWYTAPVDVMLRGEDPGGGSGVQKMEYTLNGGPVQELVPGEKVTVDAKGTTTLRYQSIDGAGRRSPMQEVTINIDGTPPVIAVPADITEYATSQDGAQVDYSATATDNVDDEVIVDCSPASGSTFPIGTTQVNCSATDTAGNEATKTFKVSVLYDFGNGSGGGFAEPVTNGVVNQVKAGAAVPVKFGLGGDFGLGIFATGYPTSRKITCDTQAVIDPIEETVAVTNSGLKYDPTAGQYHYNLKTEKAWANTCRELVVKLKDGTEHPINFKFK